MRPGMLDDPVVKASMMFPAVHLAFVNATSSPERLLTTQAANTGQDVETLRMLLESAHYRERAGVRAGVILVLGRHDF